MPFTWFIPALVQVSLILPIVLWAQKHVNAKGGWAYTRAFFIGIMLSCWAMVFTITYKYNIGATPITIIPVNG